MRWSHISANHQFLAIMNFGEAVRTRQDVVANHKIQRCDTPLVEVKHADREAVVT